MPLGFTCIMHVHVHVHMDEFWPDDRLPGIKIPFVYIEAATVAP